MKTTKLLAGKKGVFFVFLVSMLFIFAGCGLENTESEPNKPDEPATPAVDLSAYDAHGNWSCGRLWVHRNTGTYNQSAGEYGYIDEEGNLVGEWHSDQDWMVPQDFVNGRAIVYLGSEALGIGYNSGNKQAACYTIINDQCEEQLYFQSYVNYGTGTDSTITQGMSKNQGVRLPQFLHKFNEHGLLFYTNIKRNAAGYETEYCYVILEDNTQVFFDIPYEENYTLKMSRFDDHFENGFIRYDQHLGNTHRLILFNMIGYPTFDFSDFGYPISNLSEVSALENGYCVDVTFQGKDDRTYQVTVDANGTWLTEPLLINN